MGRRSNQPDKRLDWRDPRMPCIRVTEDISTGLLTSELISPPDVQAEAKNDLKLPNFPRFDSDPSYWWSDEAKFLKLKARAEEAKIRLGGFPLDCLDDCTTPNVCLYTGCKKGNTE